MKPVYITKTAIKISDVIKLLEQVKKEAGDLPVFVNQEFSDHIFISSVLGSRKNKIGEMEYCELLEAIGYEKVSDTRRKYCSKCGKPSLTLRTIDYENGLKCSDNICDECQKSSEVKPPVKNLNTTDSIDNE